MAVHRLRAPAQPSGSDTLAARMERLRVDAQAVAGEHIDAFVKTLSDAADLADQVANGGEAYQIGVREIARRIHKELAPTLLSLQAVHVRTQ